MRAHRKNGVGEYVPCKAKSADACPYGAYQHREFENGTALMQYNTIEGTGHDWDELRALYPRLFEYSGSLKSVMQGFQAEPSQVDAALEMIAAGDVVRDERNAIESMDWSDPDATLRAVGEGLKERAIRAYAAGAGVDATDLPVEMVEEDVIDAYGSIGDAASSVKASLGRIRGRDERRTSMIVAKAIAGDKELARGVALAIGRAGGDLVPPEDAKLPAASVRAFDAQVRAEAVKEYPAAANQYADSLRGIADGLEAAMKRSRGVQALRQGRWVGDVKVYIKPWKEAPDEKLKIERMIGQLRDAADKVQGNAGLDMSDAGNAIQATDMLARAEILAWDASRRRDHIGRDTWDEAFNTATARNKSAECVLGSTIRRTQGLRGYYAMPVPGTDPIASKDEEEVLKGLSCLSQNERYIDDSPDVRATASAFLRDYGLTALRPDGTMETDHLRAVRRSVTRRLTSDRYEAMLSRTDQTTYGAIQRADGSLMAVEGEARALPDRLSQLPSIPAKKAMQDPSEEAESRARILAVLTKEEE